MAFTELWPHPDYPTAVLYVQHFRPFAKGSYTIRLTVRQPALALAGVRQRLTSRYLLCGAEGIPLVIGAAATFAPLVAGIVIAVSVVLVTCSRRRAKRAEEASPQ